MALQKLSVIIPSGEFNRNVELKSSIICEILEIANSVKHAQRVRQPLLKDLCQSFLSVTSLWAVSRKFEKPRVSSGATSRRIATVRSRSQYIKSKIGKFSASDIIQNHTTLLAQEVFGLDQHGNPRPILVIDGTYLYTEKSSSDIEFQRQTYSGQKKRNLIKPMMVVATDGTLISDFDS